MAGLKQLAFFWRGLRGGVWSGSGSIHRPHMAIEPLEGRRLLSGTVIHPGSLILDAIVTPPPVTVGATARGVTLNLTAGQAFDGSVGALIGVNKGLAGLNLRASLDWGDGASGSAGSITVGASGNVDVSGSHTYTKAGKYAVTVVVSGAPSVTPGRPVPMFVVELGTIHSKVVVSPANSSGGVTIHETAGRSFTAAVGTFTTIAPATRVQASIDWGDGSSSAGTLKTLRIIGVDQIEFAVDGTHTYTKPGIYPIRVTVSQPGPTPMSPVRLITRIDSTAIVARRIVLLNGTISGTFLLAPTAADLGALYIFNGTGTAGDLGPVAAQGRVNLPGFISTGRARGTLTLNSISATAAASGSVTLKLTGPVESGFGPFPSTLNFVITGGTGVFAGAAGRGTIAVTLGGNGSGNRFSFVITSA